MAVWLLEGQSSQRDLLLALRDQLPGTHPLYASHSKHRPEITSCADQAWLEPKDDHQRLAWVLETAKKNQVKIVWACRLGQRYEPFRAQFEAEAITLITGATNQKNLIDLDNKAVFTQRCTEANIPVAQSWRIETAEQLKQVLAEHSPHHSLCVKPVQGLFGEGFWRLKPELDSYYCFEKTDQHSVNMQLWVDSYSAQLQPKPMLVMPYLSGDEYSVDIACTKGVIDAAVVRIKRSDSIQVLYLDHPVLQLAAKVIKLFACDGIVNMQTKGDANNVQHVLEVNARPAGGIGYTMHTGKNLAAHCILPRLGLPLNNEVLRSPVLVRPITISVLVEG
jgi:hypothetical protein